MSTEGSATFNAFAFQSANCSVNLRATAMTIGLWLTLGFARRATYLPEQIISLE